MATRKEYMTNFRIVVEEHPDGFVAYPLGLKGVIVGEGETYEAALDDVRSAIRFHVETFGKDSMGDTPILKAYLTEAGVEV
jgi:predicted RNase H-like HicB family nuclease